ncbi:hypothetical protein COPEUT_01000 [Coprococcus eutactus ATCC 27759]|nr:hypothetical protein COPEUT_01000 [Coprococcus eutactus ATCC 27759]
MSKYIFISLYRFLISYISYMYTESGIPHLIVFLTCIPCLYYSIVITNMMFY